MNTLLSILIIGFFLYSTYKMIKAKRQIKSQMIENIKELINSENFLPEFDYFHEDGLIVSAIAIGKDDDRILLASARVPPKLIPASKIISFRSLVGKEHDLQFKVTGGGSGPRQVEKNVHTLEFTVEDLENPHYKIYFASNEQLSQWGSRIAAWREMKKVTA